MFVDGALYDEYETNNVYEKWNEFASTSTNASFKDKYVEGDEATTGMLVIAGTTGNTISGGAIALSNVVITTFEIVDETVEIISVTTLDEEGEALDSVAGATTVKGTVKLSSYYADQQPIKVVAVAFAGNDLIGLDILDLNNIDGGATVSPEYEFTGLEGLTEIKFLAWNSLSDMKPYCAHFSK